MKATIKTALATATLLISGSAVAQNLKGGYFMEGSLFRHELNPAFNTQQSYVSLPVLGNTGVGVSGNFGVKDVFFNRNGRTVTYLHPDVSVADALGGLKDHNKYLVNVNEQILGVGFRGLGGFNTIGVNARAFVGVNLPYGIFELTKTLQNKNYEVNDLSVRAQSYVELALGHSHRIDENWRVGGKLKFLFGAGRANAEMSRLSLQLQNSNQWIANAEAKIEANVKGLQYGTKTEEYKQSNPDGTPRTYQTVDLGDIDVKNAGLAGFGVAVDLGTEYDFADAGPGLKLSLALLDLGFISWNQSHTIVNNGEQFVFDGFRNVPVKSGNEPNQLSDQADELVDKLTDLYRLQDQGDLGSKTYGIGTTLNVGVEYALPMYDKVRFGLLSTTRFQGDYTWNEERLSVNYAPCKWFELNINGGLGTFGASFGWMLNVHPVGFNFFIGMDHTLGSVSKQWVPLRSNADFAMGINFPLTKVKK